MPMQMWMTGRSASPYSSARRPAISRDLQVHDGGGEAWQQKALFKVVNLSVAHFQPVYYHFLMLGDGGTRYYLQRELRKLSVLPMNKFMSESVSIF
ncbi:unnamed protein product [Urochloa humidicola]